jgi:hypothetical protein
VSARVTFALGGAEITGWALNVSRGGLRAIVEEPVKLGGEYAVGIGEEEARPGLVVWIQEEPDGAIVGVSFLDDPRGSIPPGDDDPPKDPDGAGPR